MSGETGCNAWEKVAGGKARDWSGDMSWRGWRDKNACSATLLAVYYVFGRRNRAPCQFAVI